MYLPVDSADLHTKWGRLHVEQPVLRLLLFKNFEGSIRYLQISDTNSASRKSGGPDYSDPPLALPLAERAVTAHLKSEIGAVRLILAAEEIHDAVKEAFTSLLRLDIGSAKRSAQFLEQN